MGQGLGRLRTSWVLQCSASLLSGQLERLCNRTDWLSVQLARISGPLYQPVPRTVVVHWPAFEGVSWKHTGTSMPEVPTQVPLCGPAQVQRDLHNHCPAQVQSPWTINSRCRHWPSDAAIVNPGLAASPSFLTPPRQPPSVLRILLWHQRSPRSNFKLALGLLTAHQPLVSAFHH